MPLLPTPRDPKELEKWIPIHLAEDLSGLHHSRIKKLVDDGKIDHIVHTFAQVRRDDMIKIRKDNEAQVRIIESCKPIALGLCCDDQFRDLVFAWSALPDATRKAIRKLLPAA